MNRNIFAALLLSLFTVCVLPMTGCTDDERDYPELPFQTETEGYDVREIARELSMMQPSMEALEELWEWSKWNVTVGDHFWPGIHIKAALSAKKTKSPLFCEELEAYLRSKNLSGTREELFAPFGALDNEIWWISSFLLWDHETEPRFAYLENFSWDEPKELEGFDSDGNPIKIHKQEWIEGNVVLIRPSTSSIFNFQDFSWYR